MKTKEVIDEIQEKELKLQMAYIEISKLYYDCNDYYTKRSQIQIIEKELSELIEKY